MIIKDASQVMVALRGKARENLGKICDERGWGIAEVGYALGWGSSMIAEASLVFERKDLSSEEKLEQIGKILDFQSN